MEYWSNSQRDAYGRDTGHAYRSPFYSHESWEDKIDRLRDEEKNGSQVATTLQENHQT